MTNKQLFWAKDIAKKIPGLVEFKRFLFKKIIHKKNKKTSFSPYMIRPFHMDDLSPIPDDWRIGNGPDFVGMAAGKAGTSWWYSLLKEHPQIVNNRLNAKELHYFPHFKYCGLSDEEAMTYRMAFAAPEGSICGEWSPGYLSHPFCIEYLKTTAPNTKILILLRNPIDRMLSILNHKAQAIVRFYDFNPQQRHVYDVFDMTANEIKNSLYSEKLQKLLKTFNRDQIHVLQYEYCKLNPIEEIERTYNFLGIDDTYRPQNIKRSINKKDYSLAALTSTERKHLASYFADDVKTVSTLFSEIDPSLWSDFSDLV